MAACAAMVLAYWQQPVDYPALLTVLAISEIGAPRRNIVNLSHLNLDVLYREANSAILSDYLGSGNPVIVFVDTAELGYWQSATNHAVVVVGLEPEQVLVHDPALPGGPTAIGLGELELAWLNNDYMCAIVQPRARTVGSH